jgi:DNA-binding NarL/FixJ family response regulator
MNVLLVDDHPVLRRGLAALLQDEGIDVVGQAASAHEAIARLEDLSPDVVVLDLSLEEGSSLSLLAALHERSPRSAVVVYSVHEDGERIRRAFERGAMGYVTKREDPDVLIAAIRCVRTGERFLGARAARAMADDLARGAVVAPDEVLSPQELEVYRLIGLALGTPQIAAAMGLSVRTVETYYDRILGKLGLAGRRELRHHAAERARRSADP